MSHHRRAESLIQRHQVFLTAMILLALIAVGLARLRNVPRPSVDVLISTSAGERVNWDVCNALQLARP